VEFTQQIDDTSPQKMSLKEYYVVWEIHPSSLKFKICVSDFYKMIFGSIEDQYWHGNLGVPPFNTKL
jgi:hypothetical protein